MIKTKKLEYKGLGGWLIFVGTGLFVTVIVMLYSIYDSVDTMILLNDPLAASYVSGFLSAAWFELIAGIAFLIGAIYLIYLFFKKDRKFPKYYIIFLIAVPIYLAIDFLLTASITTSSPEITQILDETRAEMGTDLLKSVIVTVIWVWYMKKSKRVKATFIKDNSLQKIMSKENIFNKLIKLVYPPIYKDTWWIRLFRVVGWFISLPLLLIFGFGVIVFVVWFGLLQRSINYIIYSKWV